MNNFEEAIDFAKKRLISMAELDLLKRADAMANYKNISFLNPKRRKSFENEIWSWNEHRSHT